MHNASPLNAFVAQLDRAPDYGSGGLGFDSLRTCHYIPLHLIVIAGFFFI